MNYCTLSRCCNKISEDYLHENIVISTIQVGYAKNKQDLVTTSATLAQIPMKLCLFDAFLHETKESGRKKCRSAPPSEIFNIIVRVNDLTS